jgi:hypothetical protein
MRICKPGASRHRKVDGAAVRAEQIHHDASAILANARACTEGGRLHVLPLPVAADIAPRRTCAYPSVSEIATRSKSRMRGTGQAITLCQHRGLRCVTACAGGTGWCCSPARSVGAPRLSGPLAAAMLQRMPTAARLGDAACTEKSLSLRRQPIRVQKLGLSLAVDDWRRDW